MKKRRISAVLSAMVMACSAAASVVPASTNAAEGKFPKKIRTNIKTIDITEKTSEGKLKYDFNGDNKCDYYDVYEIEKFINPLYVVTSKSYYKKINNDTEVKEFNKIILKEIEGKVSDIDLFSKYDINGDNALSPDDYCSYLNVLSKQFKITVSENAGVNTQLNAAINGLADDAKIKDGVLAVPAEIYDEATDRIYPVASIADNAFAGNNDITRVEFIDYRQPDWYDEYGNRIVTRGEITACTCLAIGDGAFKNCTQLSEAVLPQNVVIGKDTFIGTPYFDNNNESINGVKILNGMADINGRNTVIAYDVDLSEAIDENGTLTIPASVTAVNTHIMGEKNSNGVYNLKSGAAKLKNIDFEKDYDSENKYNINYIGEDAFSDCKSLVTVNHAFFSYNDEYLKDQMYKYISSFNCTLFMSIETQKQLDKIVDKITSVTDFDKMNDAEKALVAAKYLVNNTYYSAWATTNTEFSLYPNALYQTIDIARGAIGSENAALNVRFTECDGISRAYALVLDSIGVKNLTMGGEGHALNQVCIDNKWYTFDLTNFCGDRGAEIMRKNKSNIDFKDYRGFDDSLTIDVDPDTRKFTYKNCDNNSIVRLLRVPDRYYTVTNGAESWDKSIMQEGQYRNGCLTNRNFFNLFRNSAGKHITGSREFYFYYNEDHTKFLVYKTSDNIKDEKSLMALLRDQSAIPFGSYGYTDDDFISFDSSSGKVIHKFCGFLSDEDLDFNGLSFYVDKNSYLSLEKDGKSQSAIIKNINGKIYAYDLNGNTITGGYSSGKEAYGFDKTGCLAASTHHKYEEWEYEVINDNFFVVIRDKNAEREQADLSKDDKKVLAYLKKKNGTVYLEDFNGSPLSGDYTAYGYTWTFDTDGRFVSTTCR